MKQQDEIIIINQNNNSKTLWIFANHDQNAVFRVSQENIATEDIQNFEVSKLKITKLEHEWVKKKLQALNEKITKKDSPTTSKIVVHADRLDENMPGELANLVNELNQCLSAVDSFSQNTKAVYSKKLIALSRKKQKSA